MFPSSFSSSSEPPPSANFHSVWSRPLNIRPPKNTTESEGNLQGKAPQTPKKNNSKKDGEENHTEEDKQNISVESSEIPSLKSSRRRIIPVHFPSDSVDSAVSRVPPLVIHHSLCAELWKSSPHLFDIFSVATKFGEKFLRKTVETPKIRRLCEVSECKGKSLDSNEISSVVSFLRDLCLVFIMNLCDALDGPPDDSDGGDSDEQIIQTALLAEDKIHRDSEEKIRQRLVEISSEGGAALADTVISKEKSQKKGGPSRGPKAAKSRNSQIPPDDDSPIALPTEWFSVISFFESACSEGSDFSRHSLLRVVSAHCDSMDSLRVLSIGEITAGDSLRDVTLTLRKIPVDGEILKSVENSVNSLFTEIFSLPSQLNGESSRAFCRALFAGNFTENPSKWKFNFFHHHAFLHFFLFLHKTHNKEFFKGENKDIQQERNSESSSSSLSPSPSVPSPPSVFPVNFPFGTSAWESTAATLLEEFCDAAKEMRNAEEVILPFPLPPPSECSVSVGVFVILSVLFLWISHFSLRHSLIDIFHSNDGALCALNCEKIKRKIIDENDILKQWRKTHGNGNGIGREWIVLMDSLDSAIGRLLALMAEPV